MGDQVPVAPAGVVSSGDPFETVMRGYHRRQVDEHLARAGREMHGLRERLRVALLEVEQLRQELSTARRAATVRPAHEEVSERMTQILRLANEEAEAQRVEADGKIARVLAEAEQRAARVTQDAQEQAACVLEAARQQSADELTSARSEATQLVAASRARADDLLARGHAGAAQLLDRASRRAHAVDDVVDHRLRVITEAHSHTVAQMGQIRQLLDGLLTEDQHRGPLADHLDELLSDPHASIARDGTGQESVQDDAGAPDAAPGSTDTPGQDSQVPRADVPGEPVGVDRHPGSRNSAETENRPGNVAPPWGQGPPRSPQARDFAGERRDRGVGGRRGPTGSRPSGR